MPSVKGKLGEAKVSARLSFLPDNEYKVIDNIMIKYGGRSVQIDHIIVSVYGIFVIETKNYKGWIFGSENSEYWTKNMYGKKYKFFNPIKQNRSHINTLKRAMGFSEDKFISIVAFSANSDLKLNTTTPVVYIPNVNQEIKKYTEQKFNAADLDDIIEKILSFVDSETSNREHVRQIKDRVRRKDANIAAGVCPYCQSRLVERAGRYGSFIGCSNYPKCKFTKN